MQLRAALDELPGWPERVRTMQANWIGRSEGVELDFPFADDTRALLGAEGKLRVFTTRADTLFGVTYVAVAAEHPVALAAAKGDAKLAAFVDECKRGSTMEADVATQEKLGLAHRPACAASAHGRAASGVGGQLRADGLRRRRGDGRAGA